MNNAEYSEEYKKGYQDAMDRLSFSLVDDTYSKENQEKYEKQRFERGFDDTETWNLDNTIAKFILPRLKRFKEIKKGYPGNLTSEEWEIILDKMIAFFEERADGDKFPDDGSNEEGIKLFAEYYNHLWW